MQLDSEEQRQHLLYFLNRAFRSADEVGAYERVREAVASAPVPEPEEPDAE